MEGFKKKRIYYFQKLIMAKITEQQIIDSLFNRFSDGYKYQVQNAFIYIGWESDFFTLSKSGLQIEVEVKTTKSDYKADFKKKTKHKVLEGKILEDSEARGRNFKNRIGPHKFFYAVPEGMIKKEEVPTYAGLIYVTNGGAYITKQAPVLHKNQNTWEKVKTVLLDKFYWNERNLKYEMQKLRNQDNSQKIAVESLRKENHKMKSFIDRRSRKKTPDHYLQNTLFPVSRVEDINQEKEEL